MQRVEKEVCGRTLSFEHGQVARQADGGLLARYGDTVILASAVYAKEPPKEYLDYFPLIVWLLANGLFATGAFAHQLWPAAGYSFAASILATVFAIRGARW